MLILKEFPNSFNKIFRVLVIKPAIENHEDFQCLIAHHRVIFTSYMDHPVGQLCGLYEAQKFYETFPQKKECCGFLTHLLYEKNPYSSQFLIKNTILQTTDEEGLGFKSLLEKENWTLL